MKCRFSCHKDYHLHQHLLEKSLLVGIEFLCPFLRLSVYVKGSWPHLLDLSSLRASTCGALSASLFHCARKHGKIGRKIGKSAENYPKIAFLGSFSHVSANFFLFSGEVQNRPILFQYFPISGRRPGNPVLAGGQGRNTKEIRAFLLNWWGFPPLVCAEKATFSFRSFLTVMIQGFFCGQNGPQQARFRPL